MLEITKIEYQERPAVGGHPGAEPYRCLILRVRLSDDTVVRLLVDHQAIRMLDAPSAKGALPRRNVEKIVIRIHSETVFSVVAFVRRGLAERARSRFMAIFQAAPPPQAEDIGISFQGHDPREVATWLRQLGYSVELAVAQPARQPTAS